MSAIIHILILCKDKTKRSKRAKLSREDVMPVDNVIMCSKEIFPKWNRGRRRVAVLLELLCGLESIVSYGSAEEQGVCLNLV